MWLIENNFISYSITLGLHTTESSQANDKQQTTMTDDVPNDDELKKDAERAITKNIDKLTDVISSSESTFQDIVLGCTAKELIVTSFKTRLLDPLTGRSTQARTAELLNHVEKWVSIKLTYLDVFLTVLTAKCGEAGREVARNVAKEYGHELPQYEAERLVIGAEGGAVSNNTATITLISEDQVIKDIKSLYQTFGSIVTDVRLCLDDSDVRRIAIYIEAIIRLGSLTEVKTIDKLFDKIQPYYSFLDCELLEAIVNEFLSANNEIQDRLAQYMNKVKEFKKSSRLRHIKTAIEEALIPKQDVTDTTCRVVIKLHEIWGRITLEHFNDVLEYLFSTRKNILAHIHIEGGSISISFIAPLSQSQYLIDNVMSKKNFFQRINIIEVSINEVSIIGKSILPANEESISINQSLIEEKGDVSIPLELEATTTQKQSQFPEDHDNFHYRTTAIEVNDDTEYNLSFTVCTSLHIALLPVPPNFNMLCEMYVTPSLISLSRWPSLNYLSTMASWPSLNSLSTMTTHDVYYGTQYSLS